MISLIVAFDKNQVIGKDNKLPWHYKEDLQYFKNTTTGKTILMGRSTFESILSYRNQPLPNRHHVVATRTATYDFDDVETISDLESYLNGYDKAEELFVIGGAMVYVAALPHANRLYITHIEREYDGDAYFPSINWDEWKLVKKEVAGELRFAVYEKSK